MKKVNEYFRRGPFKKYDNMTVGGGAMNIIQSKTCKEFTNRNTPKAELESILWTEYICFK